MPDLTDLTDIFDSIEQAIEEAQQQQQEREFFVLLTQTMRSRHAGLDDAIRYAREIMEKLNIDGMVAGEMTSSEAVEIMAIFDKNVELYRDKIVGRARELIALVDEQPETGSDTFGPDVRHDTPKPARAACPLCSTSGNPVFH